ncbi:MAG: prolipoprotein diacylglyceryl transferase [Bacteroidota bacterium]
MINVIHWNLTAEIIDGWKTPNWYSILFVSGMIIGYFVVRKMFRNEEIADEKLDKLVLYMVIPTIVGARLGAVLFYGPWYDTFDSAGFLLERGYFSHPIDILKVYEGGLASHGAAIAILISLFLYKKYVVQKSFLWILDRISAPIAIGGTFIRLGNLMNHEIVGKPSDAPWAFSFSHYYNDVTKMYDPTPRHPAQLYEAICYFIGFWILLYFYWNREKYKQPGFVFGVFLIIIFGARILIEFIKENQSDTDTWIQQSTLLNTGQWLSVPLVLTGMFLIYRSYKRPALN